MLPIRRIDRKPSFGSSVCPGIQNPITRIPGFPIKFSDRGPDPELRAHNLGEDNEAVLRELLGYDAATIAALEQEGIILAKDH